MKDRNLSKEEVVEIMKNTESDKYLKSIPGNPLSDIFFEWVHYIYNKSQFNSY